MVLVSPGGTENSTAVACNPERDFTSDGWEVINSQTIRGIYVGSTAMFGRMNRAIEQSKLRPVIDKVFSFDNALDAYAHLEGQGHFGKIVISHG